MTDAVSRAETLSRELDAAFRNRADLYRLFYDELVREVGAERAEAIMIRVVEKRGQEVAATAFADFGPADARKIGEAFLAISPDGGRMYPTDVERERHGDQLQGQALPAEGRLGGGRRRRREAGDALPHRRRLRPRPVRGDRHTLRERHLDARPWPGLLPHKTFRPEHLRVIRELPPYAAGTSLPCLSNRAQRGYDRHGEK